MRASRWDELADRYAADAGDGVSGPVVDALIEALDASARDRVLDLGCGPGALARHLARLGCGVTAVDASPRLLDVARRHEQSEPLGITFVEASASDPVLLAGQTFDRIVSSMAMSDIDDLTGTVRNVARLLEPGGTFAFSILHPCFPGHGTSRSSWSPGGYYREGWWLAEGHHGYRGVVGANHRTLSTYVNTLVAHGLAVVAMREPVAAQDVMVPMFLVVAATPSDARGTARRAGPR